MVDFEVYQGDLFKYLMTIKDDGAALDITNYKFYMTIKNNKTDTDANAVLKKEFDPSDATSGEVTIEVSSTDMATLSVTDASSIYYYDIRMETSSGEDLVLFNGSIKVLQPITQSTSVA